MNFNKNKRKIIETCNQGLPDLEISQGTIVTNYVVSE